MAITTLDQLVAGMTGTGAQRVHLAKLGTAQGAAGIWSSLWKIGGVPGGASANPAAGSGTPGAGGETMDRTKAGAIPYTNPGTGKKKYLSLADFGSTQRGIIVLYDRLVQMSGLDGTITTAQNINTVALPARDDNATSNGDGVEAWMEIYTAIGSTARTATISYTNQAGTSGQTSASFSVSGSSLHLVNHMLPIPLASGDTGVRSVQTLTLSASTGTAGNFGITLLRRIATIDIPAANCSFAKDVFDLGMPEIINDSCLALMFISDASTSANMYGQVAYAQEQ